MHRHSFMPIGGAMSALDARSAGFEASVIRDACRGVYLDGWSARAWANMGRAGINRLTPAAIGV